MRTIQQKIEAHKKYLKHPWQFWNKARFVGRDLRGCYFVGKDLRGADFRRAKFDRGVVFRDCDLQDANFKGAELEGTEFVNCTFHSIIRSLISVRYKFAPFVVNKLRYKVEIEYLLHKNLTEDNSNVIISNVTARSNPKEPFYGYKIVETAHKTEGNVTTYKYGLATLYINPKDGALVYEGYKCRCAKAFVLSIKDKDGVFYNEGCSIYTSYTSGPCVKGPCAKYKVGDYVTADSFDDTWDVECSNGIHFFMTEEEAWDYLNNCC